MIRLESGQRSLGLRTEASVDGMGVITPVMQFGLHIGDDLLRRKTTVVVNRSVISVAGIIVVTPRRVPPAAVPAPPTPIGPNDDRTIIMPPVVVVMMMAVVVMIGLGLAQRVFVAIEVAQLLRGLRVDLFRPAMPAAHGDVADMMVLSELAAAAAGIF